MTTPKRAALIPLDTPDVPQELAEQAAALVRGVQGHPDLSVTVIFHTATPTSCRVPLFVGGDVRAAAAASLAMSAGLCEMVGVAVDSIAVNAEQGTPINVQVNVGEVSRNGQ